MRPGGNAKRVTVLIVLVGAALVVVLLVAAALPLVRHNAAEADCVASVPGVGGTPGGDGSASVTWQLLPVPHWECTYRTEGGVSGATDLGWWG